MGFSGSVQQQARPARPPCARRAAALRAAGAIALLAAGACAERAPVAAAPAASFESGPASCAAGADPRLARPLTPATLDPALMDRAIRHHTNRERCGSGLAPLAAAPALAAAAAMQARDMAAAATVAPVLPADPDRTLERRYFLAGVGPHRQRGELLMRIALESPGVARVQSRAPRCAFATAGPGRALAPTHGSVARRLVAAWMRSEAMRATMLSPDWSEAGAAVAIRPVEGTCGDVYAAQSFAKR